MSKKLSHERLEEISRNIKAQFKAMEVANLMAAHNGTYHNDTESKPESSPQEAKNTPEKKPKGIEGFTGLEAALYITFTHPAGYGEEQARKDVKQFDRFTSGKNLYNNVRKIKKEDFNEVKNCTTRERPYWIDRLKNIIPHLHTDDQKKTAKEILQHLKNQNKNK